jgi:hypothetical protein
MDDCVTEIRLMGITAPEESLGRRRIGWKLTANVVTVVSESNEELTGQTAA